jgi:hypothetical protein
MFDNLGNLLKDAETRAETGRNILRDRNADTIQDLFANAKTPEEVAAANLKAQALKAQFGDMVRADDVRGLDEQRLSAVRNQITQGRAFDIADRDHREFAQVNAIEAKLASNNPVIRAEGEREALEARVRNQAALVAKATEAQRGGVRYDEEVKGFGRAAEKHVRDGRDLDSNIAYRKAQNEIGFKNAENGRISANASATNAQTGQYSAETSRMTAKVGILREVADTQEKAVKQQADIATKYPEAYKHSSMSSEGAKLIGERMKTINPRLATAANMLVEKFNKTGGVPTSVVLNALSALTPAWYVPDGSIAEDAYASAMKGTPSGTEQTKTAEYALGELAKQSEKVGANSKGVTDQLLGLLSPSAPGQAGAPAPVNPVAAAEATIRAAANPAATAPAAAPPAVTPAAPPDPVKAAEDRLKAAVTAAKDKGYYSAEMVNVRKLNSEYEDVKEAAAEVQAKQDFKLHKAKMEFEGTQAQLARYAENGQKPPKAVLDNHAKFQRNYELLTERFAKKQNRQQ